MKIPKLAKLSPKRLFSKKDRSMVSRSDPSSFSSGAASSASSDTSLSIHKRADLGTPTSVLPGASGDWSDSSCDFYSELVQAFKLIDRDNDGVVSISELEALLTRLAAEPPSDEEVATMLREVDGDGNGCVSVEALVCQIGSAGVPSGDNELRETFEVFDTDHDGKITAEELLRVFKAIGDEKCTVEECRRMIAEVDKNGDGFVCFEDFSRLMDIPK